jgi:hypothetical protein
METTFIILREIFPLWGRIRVTRGVRLHRYLLREFIAGGSHYEVMIK